MAREYVVLLDNRIRFTTTQPVSVEDAIESLRGMDRLVRAHFPKAIKKLTGAQVKSVELLVNGIEEGSLIEDTVIKLVFGSKENSDKFIGSIRDKFVTTNQNGETVVKGWVAGVLLVGLAVAGVGWYMAASKPGAAPGSLVSVNGDNNVILMIGAESYKSEPQKFAEALDKSLSAQQKKSAAKAGVQLMAPVTGQKGAGLELMSGRKSVELVSPTTAAKIPRKIEAPDNSEDASYQNVKIKFRASDGDSDQRGWAGTIDQLVEKRTRVVFANPLDTKKAMYTAAVNADVTVTYADPAHTRPILIIVEKVR